MSDNGSEFGAFLAGFFIGGLVGAAVAFIMAPQSGEETRKYIRDKSIELRTTATETAEQAREKVDAAAEKARLQVEKASEQARIRAEEAAAEARARVEEIKKLGQEAAQKASGTKSSEPAAEG